MSWCEPAKSWHRLCVAAALPDTRLSRVCRYSYDPLDGLRNDQHHLVQGGQVALWSEQADAINVEQLFWPRAAAFAEVFWRGGRLGDGPDDRSFGEALPRLHDLRYRLVRRGVAAVPLQPHWCAIRPGECDAQ
jgi:hexosaminidase